MGTAKSYSHEVELTELTKRLLTNAGYNIIYPKNLDKLCCGMAFSSKGFIDAGKKLSDELEAALLEASNGGKYPVLCDMSPCLYTMHANMDGGPLKLYEPAEFAEKYLLPRLKINKVDEKVAIFAVCSAKKLGVDQTLANIARACVSEVTVVDSNCCGFAGDRGFLLPELNKHGLRYLKEQVYGCDSGYATSRTYEIGLSYHSGVEFKSILYLLDRCSE
jgi:D-lactate dehydrogenase